MAADASRSNRRAHAWSRRGRACRWNDCGRKAGAIMSGTINLALTQQFDMDGRPLSGGLLYFFVASTTTPQSAFQDTALTIVYPNPITLDASGRVPMFYLADGNIKIRLADKNGVTVIAADNLL